MSCRWIERIGFCPVSRLAQSRIIWVSCIELRAGFKHKKNMFCTQVTTAFILWSLLKNTAGLANVREYNLENKNQS
jgi:hypothetical protein